MGIKQEAFEYLNGIAASGIAASIEFTDFITVEDLTDFQGSEFYKYDFNIIKEMKSVRNPKGILSNIEHNLTQIGTPENGDAIHFKRSFYNHSAILVDKVRLICVHRSGEPNLEQMSAGVCMYKGLVTRGHLIEIAKTSMLTKSNHIYDTNGPPR